MATQIQLRRDTAALWTSANPVLGQGEPGYETDTGKLKIGNGASAWASLAYQVAVNIADGVVSSGNLSISNQGALRLREATANGTNFVSLKAPASVSADLNFILPGSDGTAGQVLTTNGLSSLSWASPLTAGGNGVIAETQKIINSDYTLTTGYNGLSVGSVEVGATFTVTVPANSNWVIA